jgi:hypothetical protein
VVRVVVMTHDEWNVHATARVPAGQEMRIVVLVALFGCVLCWVDAKPYTRDPSQNKFWIISDIHYDSGYTVCTQNITVDIHVILSIISSLTLPLP